MAARKKKSEDDKQDETEATPEGAYADLGDNPKAKPGRLVESAEPLYADLSDNPKAQMLAETQPDVEEAPEAEAPAEESKEDEA
jgi:hypothetical protein